MKNNLFRDQNSFCKISCTIILTIFILATAILTVNLISKTVKADLPTNPILTGNTTGHKNMEYSYTALSTDPDGENISYIFSWGDESNTTTEYYPSGITGNATHVWTYAGIFNIWVQSKDQNNATSGKTYLTILIDTIKLSDLGYLIDHDGDGVYDMFQSIEGEDFHLVTNTTKQDDGTYLIDSDEEIGWNWIYDPQTDTLLPYSAEPSQETQAGNAIWYALIIGMIIVLLIILLIYMATKKKNKEDEEKEKTTKGKK